MEQITNNFILFICLQGKNRSKTAADTFKHLSNCETKSAGLDDDALYPLTAEDIAWATIIFLMERSQIKKLKKKFGNLLDAKKIICLGIPDEFEYGDEQLIKILKDKIGDISQYS